MVGGRPTIIKRNGWTIYVSVHDQQYARQKQSWKRVRAAAHPDAGGSTQQFQRVESEYQRWLEDEWLWYADLGLRPPDGWEPRQDCLAYKRLKKLEGVEHGQRQISGVWGSAGHLRRPRKRKVNSEAG